MSDEWGVLGKIETQTRPHGKYCSMIDPDHIDYGHICNCTGKKVYREGQNPAVIGLRFRTNAQERTDD